MTKFPRPESKPVELYGSFALGMAMYIFEIEVSTSKVVTNAFFFFFPLGCKGVGKLTLVPVLCTVQ